MEYPKYSIINLQFYSNGTLTELMANQGGKIDLKIILTSVIIPLVQCLKQIHAIGITHR